MLRLRLIAAACFIGPLLFIIWADDRFGYAGLWLVPLAILASQMACAETLALMAAKQLPIRRLAAHLACFAVVGCSGIPMTWKEYPVDCILSKPGWIALGMALAFCVVVIDEMIRYHGPGASTQRMANTMFVVCYAGLLMAFLVNLRLLDPSRKGLVAFLGTVMIVKLADTGAYFTGRAIGKRKMAPILSPKKTWEGASGGFVFACLGAAFVLYLLRPWLYSGSEAVVEPIHWLVCCLYGVSVTIAGMIGDLFESLLKRDAEVKDSSSWLPGLGGILDMLDSALAAAPVSFAWWITGMLG